VMRITTKIRNAKDSQKKTEIWQSLDLPRDELEQIVRDMVLSLPAGHYKLHSREYGTNIVDTMYDIYGWMPSMFVNEPMMLGLQALYPQRVYASFTLGLDAIEIKPESNTEVDLDLYADNPEKDRSAKRKSKRKARRVSHKVATTIKGMR
jgi:hypothetical protein